MQIISSTVFWRNAFVNNCHKKKKNSIIKSHISRNNKMKVQLSCLIALALISASMMVQCADASVCPDECTTRGVNGLIMCKPNKKGIKKSRCITNTKIQRKVLNRGGTCGACPKEDDNSNGRCPAKFDCNNGKGSTMCVQNSRFGSSEACVDKASKQLLASKCGRC